MKKLTNESKARFFAQYYGQKVLKDKRCFIEKHTYPLSGINLIAAHDLDSIYLELNPLQDISDEHKVWCMHRANEHIGYDQTQDYGTNIEMANHLIENEGLKSICFLSSQHQYLQSKGYALDYYCPIENRIIPVQEQIDNGWITLKTE